MIEGNFEKGVGWERKGEEPALGVGDKLKHESTCLVGSAIRREKKENN